MSYLTYEQYKTYEGLVSFKWEVVYRVGNTYKDKYVIAKDSAEAIKKSKIKNIIDLNCVAVWR